MKRLTILTLAAAAATLHFGGPAAASELVYTPVNPSFGGNPINGAWLLGSAQAQSDYKDPKAPSRSTMPGNSALDRFTSQLEARLLSQLLTDIGQSNTGSLTTDDFIVNIINDSGNLSIQITDRLTGEISEILVSGYGAPN